MTNNNVVVQAILAATKDPQIQAAMLMGSRLESSWSPSAVGDNGTSFGPFQIHLPAHPGVTQAQAEDPVWAVNYMLPAYTAGVAATPAALWGTNPAQAAATAAYHAERPAKMYSSSLYSTDWALVNAALNGTSVATGGGNNGASATTTALPTSGDTVTALQNSASNLFNDVYMAGIVMFGGALMITGLILLVKGEVVMPKIMPNLSNFSAPRESTSGKNYSRNGSSESADTGEPSPRKQGSRQPTRTANRPTGAGTKRRQPTGVTYLTPQERARLKRQMDERRTAS